MKDGTRNTIAAIVITCLTAGTLIAAEGEGKQGDGKKFPGAGELKAFIAKQHKVRGDYFKEQREANEAFRETLKEKKPSEALPSIIANRKTKYNETKTFMTGLYNEFVAHAKEIFAKHEVPADKQETMLAKMQERHEEGQAKHAEIHDKLIAALEGLDGNADLTWKDIKETIKANMPERREGRGRGNGNHKKKGDKKD